MTTTELIETAKKHLGEFPLSKSKFTAASVAAAILSKKGNVYTGVCFDISCGIGFCAEHSAVADMLKNRETTIEMAVAVSDKGVIPPCGRCRELMIQIDRANAECIIVLNNKTAKLKDLLPEHWFI